MTRLLLCLLAVVMLASPLRAADIAMEDLEVFFELVAVGPTAAVQAALEETPTLATARDPDGFAAIHMLDHADFEPKLVLLQRHGADINTRTTDGIGLIHILTDPAFLPAALAAGADINLPDTFGRTPLMIFTQSPDGAAMVQALVNAGADASLRDSNGHNAVFYARESGKDDRLIQTLITAGAMPD